MREISRGLLYRMSSVIDVVGYEWTTRIGSTFID